MIEAAGSLETSLHICHIMT